MTSFTDGKGNAYIVVGNLRVTAVPSTWKEGMPGLRFQTRGASGRLMRGPEVPLDAAGAMELLAGVAELARQIS